MNPITACRICQANGLRPGASRSRLFHARAATPLASGTGLVHLRGGGRARHYAGLGLPGALVMVPAARLIAMMAEGDNLSPRASAWPFMLFLTWLLGTLLPVAWMASRRGHGPARAVTFRMIWWVQATLYRWGIVRI